MSRKQDEYFEDRAGTKEARYHVVPDGDQWAVKREGDDDPVCTTDSRNRAIDEAKERAKETGTMVYIHNDRGRIEEQLDYGKESE